ncbi:hypothetical protein TRFO_33245 [Tritrichomonas foetus]|uniref:Uncharacterized protein n=1 Tax=Tritrichomonas foetus TaxID=1144522 RepID=A0A1J4JRL2_9EUKA|nr:hypothetical protein TRFO_33245 [Tritrichomonas foetus]|eukprot:OHT00166.1 hypothetical protein TRFO_33245 [Tritrichomonas foetus]
MAESQLFPTAVRDPYSFDTSCAVRNDNRHSMPSISHRITDKSLINQLQRNTKLKVPIVQVSKAPRKVQPKETPSFGPYVPTTSHRNAQPPELSDEAIAIMDNPDDIPTDIEILRYVRPQLLKQRDYLSDTGDYTGALDLSKIITKVEKKLQEEESHYGEMDNVRIMLTRHQELQSIVSHFINDWNKGFDEFMRATEEDAEELRQKMQEELDAYDANKPEGIDPKLCKRSPRILSMRYKEARFALAKDYEKAEHMKRIADDAEAQEAQAAMDKTYKNFLKNRKRLIAQQKQRMENFLNHAETVRRSMLTNRDRTIQGYLRRMNDLDEKIDYECEILKVKDEDVLDHPLSEARAEFVIGEELKNPIPSFRNGLAFTLSREKMRGENASKRAQDY